MSDEITEHAELYSGGSMLIRPDDPDLERVFPLADWIVAKQRFGGKVYRRVVRVVEDWVEVPKS